MIKSVYLIAIFFIAIFDPLNGQVILPAAHSTLYATAVAFAGLFSGGDFNTQLNDETGEVLATSTVPFNSLAGKFGTSVASATATFHYVAGDATLTLQSSVIGTGNSHISDAGAVASYAYFFYINAPDLSPDTVIPGLHISASLTQTISGGEVPTLTLKIANLSYGSILEQNGPAVIDGDYNFHPNTAYLVSMLGRVNASFNYFDNSVVDEIDFASATIDPFITLDASLTEKGYSISFSPALPAESGTISAVPESSSMSLGVFVFLSMAIFFRRKDIKNKCT